MEIKKCVFLNEDVLFYQIGVSKFDDRNVAAIYCRVSTKEQVNGYSLDEQKRVCRDYLHNIGIKYYRLYIDEGFTGKNLSRPGLQNMLEDCVRKKITHVIIWKLDRLSRNFNDSILLAADLNEIGIEIISVTQLIDTTTTMGKMILSIYAGNAEMEVKNLTERILIGLRARFKEGKWKGGVPPYGYRYDTEAEKLNIDDQEAEVVKLIFDKYLEFQGLKRVAFYLNENMIPTRNGRRWQATTISNILERVTYTGVLRQGEVEIKSDDLRLIDDDVFQAVKELKDERRKFAPHRKRKNKIFVGEKFCSYCGAMLFEEMRYCSECGSGLIDA